MKELPEKWPANNNNPFRNPYDPCKYDLVLQLVQTDLHLSPVQNFPEMEKEKKKKLCSNVK